MFRALALDEVLGAVQRLQSATKKAKQRVGIAELGCVCLIAQMNLKLIPIYLLLFAEVSQAQLLFKFDGKVSDSINGYYTIGQNISISLTTQSSYLQNDVNTYINQSGFENGYWYTNTKSVFSAISGTQITHSDASFLYSELATGGVVTAPRPHYSPNFYAYLQGLNNLPNAGTNFYVRGAFADITSSNADSNSDPNQYFSGKVGTYINYLDGYGMSINGPNGMITFATVEKLTISSVPEPSALSLLAVGLGGLAMLRRCRS